MLLGGLWHGGAWTFVIWGGLHGLALVIHRERLRRPNLDARASSRPDATEGVPPNPSIMRWFAWPLTIYWVCVAWIFFRAADLQHAMPALRSFVFFRSAGSEDLGAWMLWIVVVLAIVHWLNSIGWFSEWWRRLPVPAFAAGYGCAAAIVLLFIPPHYAPFIYFQF
jgi:alginate O-acetyltransferase complex protein AlgI